jgi:hypothetical protein
VRASYLEIYNGKAIDLLQKDNKNVIFIYFYNLLFIKTILIIIPLK